MWRSEADTRLPDYRKDYMIVYECILAPSSFPSLKTGPLDRIVQCVIERPAGLLESVAVVCHACPASERYMPQKYRKTATRIRALMSVQMRAAIRPAAIRPPASAG